MCIGWKQKMKRGYVICFSTLERSLFVAFDAYVKPVSSSRTKTEQLRIVNRTVCMQAHPKSSYDQKIWMKFTYFHITGGPSCPIFPHLEAILLQLTLDNFFFNLERIFSKKMSFGKLSSLKCPKLPPIWFPFRPTPMYQNHDQCMYVSPHRTLELTNTYIYIRYAG